MISKINTGIISGIGLIIFQILHGIISIPNLVLTNIMVVSIIIQVGIIWFRISLWISLKYALIKLNNQNHLEKYFNWLISNLAIISGLGIVSIIFPSRELFLIEIIVVIILVINYILLFSEFHKMDKNDLNNINDILNYVLSIIILVIVLIFGTAFNELKWHTEIDFIYTVLGAIPTIFLIFFLKHEKEDVKRSNASV